MGRHIGDRGLFAGGKPRKEANKARYDAFYGEKRLYVCQICRKEFKRYVSVIVNATNGKPRKQGIFCSKKCFGSWLGKNHKKSIN